MSLFGIETNSCLNLIGLSNDRKGERKKRIKIIDPPKTVFFHIKVQLAVIKCCFRSCVTLNSGSLYQIATVRLFTVKTHNWRSLNSQTENSTPIAYTINLVSMEMHWWFSVSGGSYFCDRSRFFYLLLCYCDSKHWHCSIDGKCQQNVNTIKTKWIIKMTEWTTRISFWLLFVTWTLQWTYSQSSSVGSVFVFFFLCWSFVYRNFLFWSI